MVFVYNVQIVKTVLRLTAYILHAALCEFFQRRIAMQPVTQNQGFICYMTGEDFLKFINRRPGPVHRSGKSRTLALNTCVDTDLHAVNTSFLSFCPMLSGLSASFIGNRLSFIRFQDISLVQFCNLFQDNGIVNRFFIKREKNLMPHMEDTIVRQARRLTE